MVLHCHSRVVSRDRCPQVSASEASLPRFRPLQPVPTFPGLKVGVNFPTSSTPSIFCERYARRTCIMTYATRVLVPGHPAIAASIVLALCVDRSSGFGTTVHHQWSNGFSPGEVYLSPEFIRTCTQSSGHMTKGTAGGSGFTMQFWKV